MINILFVDDEPAVLEGLENRLRPWRTSWSMRFAGSGAAALEMLARKPADVVVTDMLMPGMDGAALLREVRERLPEAVRVVLSGQTDRQGVLRSMPLAHQFIAKPCEGSRLQAVVTRACTLRDRLFSHSVKAAIAGLGTLPVLPRLYWDLCRELERPDVSVPRVAAILEQDIALTARVLQLVNSAFFACPRPVIHIRDAVAVLGIDPLRAMVASVEIMRAMSEIGMPPGFSLQRLQAHSLQAALVAQQLLTDATQRPMAIAAAMLHDIGHLVLSLSMPEQRLRVRDHAISHDMPIAAAEQEIIGCTHADVGAHLLALWGLPQALVETVAYHHAPGEAGESTFSVTGALHVADWLVHPRDCADRLPLPEVDRAYLAKVGELEHLDEWEERFGVQRSAPE